MTLLLETWLRYSSLINGTLLLGILALLLRYWIQSRRLRIEERKNDRDGYGDLIDRLERRIEGCEHEAIAAKEAAAQAKATALAMKGIVLRLHSLVHLLQTELERIDPESEILKNARMMLQHIYRDIEMIPGDGVEPLQDMVRKI